MNRIQNRNFLFSYGLARVFACTCVLACACESVRAYVSVRACVPECEREYVGIGYIGC